MIGTALGTCSGIERNVFSADWTYLRCPGSNAFLFSHGLFRSARDKCAPLDLTIDLLAVAVVFIITLLERSLKQLEVAPGSEFIAERFPLFGRARAVSCVLVVLLVPKKNH